MNRKILVTSVAMMAVAILVTPALAIGPQNAGKNPNADFSMGWAQLFLPSELFIEWVPSIMGNIFFQHMNADNFQIKNAVELTIASPADFALFLTMENKWIYITEASYATFLSIVGIDPSFAEHYPDGLYIRFVIVGK